MAKKRAGQRGAQVPPPAPPVASEGSRARIAIVGAVLVAIVAAGAWWWLRTPAFAIDVNADRNVLLVTIDTLRADALGSYGGRASHAEPGSARRPRRPLHVRALARGRHAALARLDPDRPVPVRARHPRQHRLSSRADAGDSRDAAQGAGLRDGRVRRRLSARSPLRPRRRIRCLRRRSQRSSARAQRASASEPRQ